MEKEKFIFRLYGQRAISSLYIQPAYCRLTKKHLRCYHSSSTENKGLYLVKDIPDYLQLEPRIERDQKRFITIEQYGGYLLHLSEFSHPQAYLEEQLSKRNRKNLISKKGKLEREFDISYQMYFGELSTKQYDIIF